MGDLAAFIAKLKTNKRLSGAIVHHRFLPRKPAEFSRSFPFSNPRISKALEFMGIEALYLHQAQALERLKFGDNIIVATPTASGKTLIYNLAALNTSLEDPTTRSLYIFPLKALEQDQLRVTKTWIRALGMEGRLEAAIYDGDTPAYRRKKLRESPPQVLITNPDMVHLSILPFHQQWKELFENLRFVVLDEVHTYKGIFGSHIVQVLRRLNRICRAYGTQPQFIALSATIANPGEFAQRLTGLPFSVIEESGAPRTGRHVIFVNPTESPYTVATYLFREAIACGFKTIAFTQARKITELIHTWLVNEDPDLAKRVSSYRAGFLPEERRQIERRLASGEMDGVISTSALEMGIDIGELDVCILIGYPGTIIQTWQRGGRVGRQGRDSLLILVAQPDALDQYFMRNPDRFFQSGYEKAIVDPENRVVLKGHLACAAAELPLKAEGDLFSVNGEIKELIEEMEVQRMLLRSASGEEWYSPKARPQRDVDIRATGESFTIIEEGTKKIVGQNSGVRTFTECHEGAIYLHRGEHYLVTRLDLEQRDVWVKRVSTNYYTRARSDKETEILKVKRSRPIGNSIVRLGRLRVTERITGYEKRRITGQELLGVYPLDLPPIEFETVGIWLEIEDFVRKGVEDRGLHFMGGIHAAEHAIIALFPLFALCDRDDVGGISIPFHPQVGKAAIFVYDGHPEGVGLAERAYEVLEDLLEAALSTIESCDCEAGCPGCIHSPKCGSGNKPLDKKAAVIIISALLGKMSPKELGVELLPEENETEGKRPAQRKGTQPHSASSRILVFDLETQKTAEDVGGWHNKHLMRLSLAVVYDLREGSYHTFIEDQVQDLIHTLKEADLVVGFNVRSFDYKVLSAYTPECLEKIPTFDILEEIRSRLGFRLGLDHIAYHTLGERKTADGLQAVAWFREGRFDELEAYCRKDVEITTKLFEFGCTQGYLVYETKEGRRVRLPVDWDLNSILKKVKEPPL